MDPEFLQVEFDEFEKVWMEDQLRMSEWDQQFKWDQDEVEAMCEKTCHAQSSVDEDDIPLAKLRRCQPPAAVYTSKKPMTHTEFLYDQCPELRKVMENFAGSDLAYHMEDVPGPSDKDRSGRKGPSGQTGPSNGGGGKRPSNSPNPVQPEPPKPVPRGPNRAWVESLKDKYTVIKGHVQSGKTNFMICASALFVSMGYSVVHLLRDRKSDRDQIHGRLLCFQENYNKAFGQTMRVVKTLGSKINTKSSVASPKIYLALGNESSVKKVLSIVKVSKHPCILFIDEVDNVDSGNATKKHAPIQELKKRAYCVFGVSATIMDPLSKENITSKNIILLGTESKHGVYKGIDSIELMRIDDSIKCVYSGATNRNLFVEDEGLKSFIDEFMTRQPIVRIKDDTEYPNICLVNICRTKDPCLSAQIELGKTHPKLATIVYNGDGISFRQGSTSFKERTTISSFLQKLKDNGGVAKYPHIMIFAGDLAGRCISFVSDDYTWHLSDQRLLVADGCTEPELIQKIRLCGVYKDNINLRLYTTKKTVVDLRKAYLRQEEIICALKSHGNISEETARTLMPQMTLSKDKFSNRSMTNDENAEIKIKKVYGDDDGGWDVDAYKMAKTKDGSCVPKALPPASYYEAYGRQAPSEAYRDAYEEEYEDEEDLEERKKSPYIEDDEDAVVIAYIEKILAGKQTFKAMFLSELDNRGLEKTFTYDEIIDMLKDSKYKNPTQILPSYCGKIVEKNDSHKIFNVSNEHDKKENRLYTVRPELHIAWRS